MSGCGLARRPPVQKAGVMLGNFFSQGMVHLHLFDEVAPRSEIDEELFNI